MQSSALKARVIAVAAPIGGGKSALVSALAQALGNAPTLHFDAYETATRQSVEELGAWLAAGADFSQLLAPGLVHELEALRSGSGRGDGSVDNVDNVIFEMPLGRAWLPGSALIDVLVWVDVPLDLALARRLREMTADLLQGSQGAPRDGAVLQRGLAWLHDYLAHYTSTLHAVLQAQQRAVQPQADLVVDGREPVARIVADVLTFLAARRG